MTDKLKKEILEEFSQFWEDMTDKDKNMKKYTINQIKKSKSALIVHPCFGSLVMDIKKVLSKEKIVEGLVWNETGYFQYNMPDDYHGEYEYMNFPFSCIKKLYNEL